MSFLDSVLSSIETGKPSPIPPTSASPSPPVTSSNVKTEVRKPVSVPRDGASERKPLVSGIKRKAEEQLAPPRPRPSAPSTTATSAVKSRSSTPQQKAPPVSSKPPPKGSFADLMAKAKALQEKAPTQVGMFKHQSAPKEKLSKVERKKKAVEAQTKDKDVRSAKKAGVTAGGAAGTKAGDGKVVKKREPEPLSYKGTARPTPSTGQPEYRGTAGLPPRKTPGDRKAQSRSRPRMDEYLGTDEEDEGEYADDYDDYYSESSDMEAGLYDVEEEEAAALAAARREDEEEWRAELAAKQQKLERRKKLASLASRR
ncbi:40S ribosomal protein S17-B [Aspergillus niger]|uniref:40S ribosomal protein S17-B n=1 Tax=Aspergillus niger TaxID=5061 RepID=A0A505IG74_ASPNG|nr:40S ribosomal protein S17-B [Aspergillus niger]